MNPLFDEFIREKRFLNGLSENTLRSYGMAFKKFDGYELNKKSLNEFVIGMRGELKPGACNVYIRSINSFLSWCYENEHTSEHLRIKEVKKARTIIEVFTEKQLKTLITQKSKKFTERRLHALIVLLIDTGARIDEALNLRKHEVDFDNLIIKVRGKGDKDRIIPISRECRAVLFRFCRHEFEYLFPAKHSKWLYRNALRDFKNLCIKLGIVGARCSFHTLRHYYAISYIRAGGDLYRLSKILGHSEIQTTSQYLRHMGIEPIREAHQLYSPLSRL